VETEVYYGYVNKQYVCVDNINKKYTVYNSVSDYNNAFINASREMHSYLNDANGTYLVDYIKNMDDSYEVTYKSSGEDNLYLKIYGDNEREYYKEEVEYKNYLISSDEQIMNNLDNGEIVESFTFKFNCTYKTSRKMPNIKNY
jgi:hypothetical protein